MSDTHTPDQRHRNMAAIHSASTKPELKLRHALWHLGFRFRVNDTRYPGTPDIVLPKFSTVILVHGCFWHGHRGCKYYTIPGTNTDFWTAKIARNQERDQEVWRQLEAQGWFVIIVWECQLKKAVFEDTLNRVVDEIRRNGEQLQRTKDERKASWIAYLQERRTQKERVSAHLTEIKSHFINR